MNKIINIFSGLTGKLLFVIPLIMFGISHFTNASALAGMVPFPGKIYWVYLTGVLLLAGAIGIITNHNGIGPLAAFLTGIMILAFALLIHLPGVMHAQNEAAKMMPMLMFLKDLGLAGGAFILAGSFRK